MDPGLRRDDKIGIAGKWCMKKWLPFILIILAVFILVIFLILSGRSNNYRPATSNPALVYKEACMTCHGERGEGNGFLYPDLSEDILNEKGVFDIVRKGGLFMPSFPAIADSTLTKLAIYISDKGFKTE